MRKVTALLLAASVLAGTNTALADKTITLDKDTKLVPQGWTVADDIKFKKNTVVKLNDDGQVIEGVLASATYLRPAGWKSLRAITIMWSGVRRSSHRASSTIRIARVW